MLLTRRTMISGSAGGAIALGASSAGSQPAYPERRVTLVVPFAPGGATDFLGRLVAKQFKTGMAATIVVENKPGAGSILGANQVAKAAPDGYTLLMATSTTLAINKTLYPKLPYDPITDFSPIALVAAVPFALVVNPSLPINSLDEFINYVKARPGELSYGSVGNGSPHHLGGAMLNSAAGLDIKHVPYKGSALAMQDVIGGHIPLMVIDLPPALPYIRDGELRALGVTTAARVGAAPEIPTLAEVGFAGFELVAWQGVVAPAGVPRLIVDQLAGEIAALTSAPETRTMLNALALEPLIGSTPDSFARFVKSEIDRWAPIEGVGCIAGMSCAPRASAQAEHADAGRRRYARPDRRRWTGGAQHTHHPDARRYWPMDSHDAQTIPCPRCGRSMKLVHTIPKLGGIPELLIFSCQTCGEVETREVVQAAYAQGSGIHGEPRATP